MSDGMLSTLAKEIDGRLTGADTRFSGVSTDTRTIADGNVFFALSGPAFDGHAFVDEAASRGAAAAVVSREVSTSLPTINVEDTRSALGAHAAAWRNRFSIPVVAVTGSNGKTTWDFSLIAATRATISTKAIGYRTNRYRDSRAVGSRAGDDWQCSRFLNMECRKSVV